MGLTSAAGIVIGCLVDRFKSSRHGGASCYYRGHIYRILSYYNLRAFYLLIGYSHWVVVKKQIRKDMNSVAELPMGRAFRKLWETRGIAPVHHTPLSLCTFPPSTQFSPALPRCRLLSSAYL